MFVRQMFLSKAINILGGTFCVGQDQLNPNAHVQWAANRKANLEAGKLFWNIHMVSNFHSSESSASCSYNKSMM